MGGQACVLYGGAEFSRDTDIVVVASADNLRRLQAAVNDLQAESIAVPPFEQRFLEAGHAVHFRCRVPEADGIRLDVMSEIGDGSDISRHPQPDRRFALRSGGGGEGFPIAVAHEPVPLAQILRLDPLGGQGALGQTHFVRHAVEVAEKEATASAPDASGVS